jgi:hypothetical protein
VSKKRAESDDRQDADRFFRVEVEGAGTTTLPMLFESEQAAVDWGDRHGLSLVTTAKAEPGKPEAGPPPPPLTHGNAFDPHNLTRTEERWAESPDGRRAAGSFRPALKRPKHAVHIYNPVTGAEEWRALASDADATRQFLESVSPGPLEEVAAPFKQGRQSPAEQARRAQLARLAAAARKRGATEEAIGAVLGGRTKQRIHELLRFAAQLPSEPVRINSDRPRIEVEIVSRECEECGVAGGVMRRERLNPDTLGIERRRLCKTCNTTWQREVRGSFS